MNRSIAIYEKILIAILLIRPSLDLFTQVTFPGSMPRLNPAALLSLFIILLGAVYFWRLPRHEKTALIQHPLMIGLCVWIVPLFLWAMLPIGTAGMERINGMREWVRLFSLIPLVLMVLHINFIRKKPTLVYAVLYSFILPAVVGYAQWIFGQGDQIKNVQRISSTFVHPNSFAFYLVLIAGLSYWQLRCGRHKAMGVLFLPASLSLLIGTFSFTGAVTLMTAAFVFALGENRALRIAAVACVLLFCLAFAITPTGYKRLQEEIHIENLDEIERTGKHTTSLTWRLVNWRFLYRQWKQSPWVGHGLDSIPRVNPMLNSQKIGSDAHNDYIRYGVETGVIGLGLFLFMMAQTGRALLQSLRQARGCATQRLAWTAVALYCAWMVGATADNLISVTAYQYALWTVFACAASVTLATERFRKNI